MTNRIFAYLMLAMRKAYLDMHGHTHTFYMYNDYSNLHSPSIVIVYEIASFFTFIYDVFLIASE